MSKHMAFRASTSIIIVHSTSDAYTYRQMNDDGHHDDDHDDDDYDDYDEYDEYDEYLYSSWPGIQHG